MVNYNKKKVLCRIQITLFFFIAIAFFILTQQPAIAEQTNILQKSKLINSINEDDVNTRILTEGDFVETGTDRIEQLVDRGNKVSKKPDALKTDQIETIAYKELPHIQIDRSSLQLSEIPRFELNDSTIHLQNAPSSEYDLNSTGCEEANKQYSQNETPKL